MGKIVRGDRPLLSRRDFLKLGGVSLAGTGLLGLTGCGGEETIGGGSREGGGSVFIYAQGLDVLSLDPPNQADDTSSAVASYIFDTLLQYPLKGAELAPWLAAEVPEPDDGGALIPLPCARASSSTTARRSTLRPSSSTSSGGATPATRTTREEAPRARISPTTRCSSAASTTDRS